MVKGRVWGVGIVMECGWGVGMVKGRPAVPAPESRVRGFGVRVCRCRGSRKVDVRLPGKGNSNFHGARPVHLIITMIEWIENSRLSMNDCLPIRLRAWGLDVRAGRRPGCTSGFELLFVAEVWGFKVQGAGFTGVEGLVFGVGV